MEVRNPEKTQQDGEGKKVTKMRKQEKARTNPDKTGTKQGQVGLVDETMSKHGHERTEQSQNNSVPVPS